jgi:hypothetical protein
MLAIRAGALAATDDNLLSSMFFRSFKSQDAPMGSMTRKQGTTFVFTSDSCLTAGYSARAPKRQSNVYEAWTGECWSKTVEEAKQFDTVDHADEYVCANYGKVTGQR